MPECFFFRSLFALYFSFVLPSGISFEVSDISDDISDDGKCQMFSGS